MRVFITGASSGIGAAMAKKFDAMGAQLGLVGRSQEKLDAVLSSMQNTQALEFPKKPIVVHDFFAYTDRDSGLVNVLYRRDDGGYGLLKQAEE